jgi:hypothetical protein
MTGVTSEIWVQAFIRRCQLMGLSAVLVRRGAREAGTIFLTLYVAPRAARLFGPPPGPAHDESGERIWGQPLGAAPVAEAEIAQYLARQVSFDPDIWIVDVDDDHGQALEILSQSVVAPE